MDSASQETLRTVDAPAFRVLIAEDDVPLSQFLRRSLQDEQNGVDLAHDGEAALQALAQNRYGLLILDLNLPKRDGISVLQEIRPKLPSLPILVLTAKSKIEDKISALEAGADDCMVKPFSFPEFVARTKALRRRNGGVQQACLQLADLSLNRSEFRVKRADRLINLTTKEFALLEYLMTAAPKPVTRAMIMENVWKEAYSGSTNLIDVYVKYLRDKVDKDFPNKLIKTIRGIGYVISAE